LDRFTRIHQDSQYVNVVPTRDSGCNQFLAKLASDEKKPDGLFVITPKMGPGLIEKLPVGKFHGIGPATTAKMNSLAFKQGRTFANANCRSSSRPSERPGGSINGLPAASMNGPCVPTACASL
jgi:hypothetical protein